MKYRNILKYLQWMSMIMICGSYDFVNKTEVNHPPVTCQGWESTSYLWSFAKLVHDFHDPPLVSIVNILQPLYTSFLYF